MWCTGVEDQDEGEKSAEGVDGAGFSKGQGAVSDDRKDKSENLIADLPSLNVHTTNNMSSDADLSYGIADVNKDSDGNEWEIHSKSSGLV